MKKMMITAFAVAVAAIAQAATVSWGITGVTEGGTALTKGHVYMFFTTGDAAAEISAIKALAGTGADSLTAAMASANWNDTKKATAAGTFSMGSSAALGGYTLPTNAQLGLSGATAYQAYAVIFDTETITEASNYIVTDAKPITTLADSASQNKLVTLGNQSGATWNAVAVPEPTSGLMLLLGMAGLALRRRRA